MLFSIIIPMYNPGKRIVACLNSILKQTYKDYEVVIINDGTTDGSDRLVKAFATEDHRIKLFNFLNAGVGISRRRGINLCSGDYILFVDSDDEIAPLLLEILYNIIIRHPEVDIIRHQSKLLNDSSFKNPERYNYHKRTEELMTGVEALKEWSIPHHKYSVYWLFLFRTSIFKDHDWEYPEIRCHEDLALIPLLIATAKKVYVTSYIGYYQFQNNPTSITNSEKELDKLKDFFAAYDFAVNNFRKLEEFSKDEIDFLVNDYKRRLISKVDSLSEKVNAETFASEVAKRLGN